MISLIGKLDWKGDWVEIYMERMIGSLGKLGRKVDIGRNMNDPDEALDPWSCSISVWPLYIYICHVKKRIQLILEYTGPRLVKSRIDQVDSQKENGYFFQENQSLLELAEPILS